jgi:hypothetical protein
MKPLVQWIYHRVGYNDMWDVLSYDFFTLRTFYSVTYHSGMSRAMAPYVAASYSNFQLTLTRRLCLQFSKYTYPLVHIGDVCTDTGETTEYIFLLEMKQG